MAKGATRRRKSKEEKLNEAKDLVEATDLSEEAEGDLESVEDSKTELEEAIGFDIFEYGTEQQKLGDQVKYIIKRNGEMLASRFHPFSWEKLQEEYGAGQYQIVARSIVKQRYLKSETRSVANPGNGQGVQSEFAFGKPKRFYQDDRLDRTEEKPGFTEMWGLMNESSQNAKQEARELARSEKESSNTMLTSLITMIQNSQTNSQSLFLSMMKSNQEGLDRISENTNQMFRDMNDKFEKIVDKIGSRSQNKEEFGIFELMKLQNDSRDSGFEMFNKMQELAEAKAEEKAEILAGRESGEDKKEKSLTETVVEALLPAISTSLGNKNAQIQAQPDAYQDPNAHPMQRRALPRTSAPTNALQNRPGTHEAQNVKTSAAKNAEVKENSGEIGGSDRPGSIKINKLGLPGGKIQEKTTAQDLSNKENAKVWEEDSERQAIEEILTPVIVDSMVNMRTPGEGANLLMQALAQHQITPKKFFAKIPKEYILEIVRKYDLPVEAISWLEEVYANLQIAARMDNQGEPA